MHKCWYLRAFTHIIRSNQVYKATSISAIVRARATIFLNRSQFLYCQQTRCRDHCASILSFDFCSHKTSLAIMQRVHQPSTCTAGAADRRKKPLGTSFCDCSSLTRARLRTPGKQFFVHLKEISSYRMREWLSFVNVTVWLGRTKPICVLWMVLSTNEELCYGIMWYISVTWMK